MWGRKQAERHYGSQPAWSDPPNFDRGYRWTGVRYEYLFLKGLPLGDVNQAHLPEAGQHGWRAIQVGVDVSALGHAMTAWAMMERKLPPVAHDYQAHLPEAGTRYDEPVRPFYTRRMGGTWPSGQPDNL